MSKVKFSDFDVERVEFKAPESKSVPNNAGEYSFLKVGYNYGTPDEPRIGRLLLELPKCTANRGIETRINDKGQISHSIQAKFENPTEAEELLEKLQALEKRVAKKLFEYYSHPNMHHINVDPDDDALSNVKMIQRDLNKIMYVAKDKQTKRRIPGSVPSMYLKLDAGTFDPKYKSRFFQVVGIDPITKKPIVKPIEWEYLEEMCVTYTPLVNFYRVFTGQLTRCIQSKMISATVDSLKEPEIINPQEELAMQLASDPKYLEQIEAGLKLARERAAARAAGSPTRTASGLNPLTATDLVAGVTSSFTSPEKSGSPHRSPADGSGETKTSSRIEVTSSFPEFMAQTGSKTSAAPPPMFSKIPSLPSVPSAPSMK